MEILVVKMSALGDVIHALPIIPALKSSFPDARIHWLVEESAAPLIRLHSGIDETYVFPRRRWAEHGRHPNKWGAVFGEIRDLIRELKGLQYDLAIDLQGLLKSGIWMQLVEATRKVGFNGSREGSRMFVTERICVPRDGIHAVERYLRMVEAIGADLSDVDFGLSPPGDARDRISEILDQAGESCPKSYAVIVPSARWETKEWSACRFAELADRLVEDLDLQIVMTGISGEHAKTENIMRMMKHQPIDLAGKTDVHALMALLEGARVVISVDSGPMHLAAALGTPVVALFGPTAPWRTGPYGRGHRIIRASVACSPCFRRECSSKVCMDRIDPMEVREAAGEVMRGALPSMEKRNQLQSVISGH
jgi:3-deoxy-D-manno-octulosonic-acid transferase/heptosyltransferase-1